MHSRKKKKDPTALTITSINWIAICAHIALLDRSYKAVVKIENKGLGEAFTLKTSDKKVEANKVLQNLNKRGNFRQHVEFVSEAKIEAAMAKM